MPLSNPQTAQPIRPPSQDVDQYPVEKKSNYHHGNLRAALVVAGLELLDTKGLEAISLRAIAARVGVSHTAPKNHFSDIGALRTAIATEGFWRLAKALKDAGGTSDTLQPRAEAYVRFALEHRALFRLMYSPGLADPDDATLREAEAAALATIARPSEAGGEAPANPDRQAWAMMHGFAMLAIAGRITHGDSKLAVGEVIQMMPKLR